MMETINDCYNNLENYLIKKNKTNSQKCLICFSSDGLYHKYGNTEYDKVRCLKSGRFEFFNTTNVKKIKKSFCKVIFLRDPLLKFYFYGINSKINNFQLLVDFLREETSGLDVYIVGNSSGGYAALLMSLYLNNVINTYVFGAVIDPYKWPDFEIDNINNEYFEFMDLKNKMQLLHNNVFTFYSAFNKYDTDFYNLIKNSSKFVHVIRFDTQFHAETVWSYDYKYIFTCNANKLVRLSKNDLIYSRKRFSLKLQGPCLFFYNVLHYLRRKKYLKKYLN